MICSLVFYLHGLGRSGGPLSRDVRCIYYPVPLLLSLALLGLYYPRERSRKLKTVLLRRGAFSIGFGYIISIFLGNLGAEVFF